MALKDILEKMPGKKIVRLIVTAFLILMLGGFAIRCFGDWVFSMSDNGKPFRLHLSYFIQPQTFLAGFVAVVAVGTIWLFSSNNLDLMLGTGKGLLGKKGKVDVVKGSLENSRFLTDKERDKYFPEYDYDVLNETRQDGIPVRAVLDKNNHLQVNFLPGAHSLIIGATGSGKTTTFINPMIQLLGATACGSSMIMTDPKGELFSLHSQFLVDRGYRVLLLDLRDTYSSSRWNPLGSIWDMYAEYIEAGKGIIAHRDRMDSYPDLARPDGDANDGETWFEWRGKA